MNPGMVPESRLDEARAEIERLRAALAVFADEANWAEDIDQQVFAWIGESERPWTIAREALAEKTEAR
jgi:hypothetical protein